MRDIAERVLMHMEAGVGGDVDLPLGDVLAVMAARRHPQDLNDAGRGRLVAVAGGMRNSQAHGTEFPVKAGKRAASAIATSPKGRGRRAAPGEGLRSIDRP